MKKFISLLSAAAIIFSCFTVQLATVLPVAADGQSAKNVSFRTLDDFSGDIATEYEMKKEISEHCTEGSGSVAFTVSETQAEGKDLFFYMYAVGRNPVDASGTAAMIFDMYCPTEQFASALYNFTGDGGVNLDSASVQGSWNNSAGRIGRTTGFKKALKDLKVGWNHIVMYMDETMTVTDLSKFRFYITGIELTPGTVFLIDDVRFVNEEYLNSTEYTDTIAAKEVHALISALNFDSSNDEVNSVKEKYDELSDVQKSLVTNLSKLEALLLENADPMCITFRTLDSSDRTAQEAATSTQDTDNRLEGTGAAMFEYAAERKGGLFWYVYCDSEYAQSGFDITGATYILFDFYVSDPDKWDLSDGDARIGIRSTSSNGWDSGCAEVSAKNLVDTFKTLKKGWNHVVLPLNVFRNDAFAFRMYFAKGSAQTGFYTIMDDVRFCNKKYLESQAYTDTLAAKDVAAIIGALDKLSTPDELSNARAAYNELTDSQKPLVCNIDRLTRLENGQPLYDKPEFTELPENALSDRTQSECDFSIAAISDLHYAHYYHGQQQDIYYDSMKWIVQNAEKEKIKMAVQLGDATNGNRLSEWQTVRKGYDILKDGGVAYTGIIGNHDYGNGKNPLAFNTYLPFAEETAINPYYGGAMKKDHIENAYYLFEVNGVKYMILNLECYPESSTLSWADSVVKEYSDYNVILFTHSYLDVRDGKIGYTHETEALAAGFTGESVWEGLVKTNSNIIMTVSAHNFNSGKLALYTNTNDAGKTVYQYLVPDPQDYEATHGAMGFVCLIRFYDLGQSVKCEYVATRYDKVFSIAEDTSANIDPVYDESLADASSAKRVERAIRALPQKIRKSDAPQVQKTLEDYNALSENAKALVPNYRKLADAEEFINTDFGNLNGDDKITAEDALLCLQHVVGKYTLDEKLIKAADVNQSGDVTADDALLILQRSVDKIPDLPIEKQ